ncbi:MAG TPA: aldo/keto reductase [Steroidobacteraceae bacterium]|jgi:aryl-alcohol dehydrogenase-like predicted oxidoreductase|nr:aldo/keto reductase [Steroidobacteraceae bacterium]
MQTRKLGPYDVTAIGFGCMNLSHAYGPPQPREVAERVIAKALDLGVTHFDTAALYGFGANEKLVGSLLAKRPDHVIVASKCGLFGRDGKRVIDGRPESIRAVCEQSLRNLGTDRIDLYYLHRWDKTVPLEDSVGALAELKRQGKIRAIGLSEVGATSLRKAHAVHPVAALQSEYSLWTRNPEIAVLEECRRLGVTLVAFSPLGRGFLAGRMRSPGDLLEGDIRRTMPRFQSPNFEENLRLLDALDAIAAEVGCSRAQLALAWVLAKAPHAVVIPGTTREVHVAENCGADAIRLDAATVGRLDAVLPPGRASGARYPPATQVENDTEEF